MPTLLLGEYREGVVTLREKPANVPEGGVRVLLVPDLGAANGPRMLAFGKHRGGRMSTPDDFREAEWHGREGLRD
jgi:hypothetical protein